MMSSPGKTLLLGGVCLYAVMLFFTYALCVVAGKDDVRFGRK